MADLRRSDALAFDVWLKRALSDLYHGIASEQVPDEMLDLLRDPGAWH